MKINLIVIILIVNMHFAYAEKIHNYNEELVHSFTVGSDENQIGLLTDTAYENKPTSLTYSNDSIIIGDFVNGRLVIYDNDFNVVEVIDNIGAAASDAYYEIYDNILFGSSGSIRDVVIDRVKNKIVRPSVYYFNKTVTNYEYSIYTPNVIFSYLNDGSLVSFVLEDKSKLSYSKVLTLEETQILFNDKKKYGLEGYSLDSKNRLFFKDKIQNKGFDKLYDYWSEIHNKNNDKPTVEVPGLPGFTKLEVLKGDAYYTGKDNQSNTYWYIHRACIIFSEDGWPIDYFKFNKKPLFQSTVDNEGNVLYLTKENINNEVVLNLYKIERDW